MHLPQILAAIVLGIGLMGCSSPERRAFMQGCTEGAGFGSNADDICSCTYDGLIEKISEEELAQVQHPSQLPPEFAEVFVEKAMSCAAKYS
jgi:hypothetical protein